jgi:hypothetical protein
MAGFDRLVNYSLLAVKMSLGSAILSAFGEDGGALITPISDRADYTIGTTGEAVTNSIVNPHYELLLQLMPTGRATLLVQQIWDEQEREASENTILPVPFKMKDPATQETFACQYTRILRGPDLSKGPKIGTHEWKLFLCAPKWSDPVGNLI